MRILYLYFLFTKKTKLDELLETTIEKNNSVFSKDMLFRKIHFSILVFLINSTDCWIISLFSSSNDNPSTYFMLSAFLE